RSGPALNRSRDPMKPLSMHLLRTALWTTALLALAACGGQEPASSTGEAATSAAETPPAPETLPGTSPEASESASPQTAAAGEPDESADTGAQSSGVQP